MNLAFFQADVFTTFLKEISPGVAILIGMVYLLTRVAIDMSWMRRELSDIKISAVTKEGMRDGLRIALLELRREMDEEYEERFQRNGHASRERAAGA